MFEYVESFPNGTGYLESCAGCGGSIGESSACVMADGVTLHIHCYND